MRIVHKSNNKNNNNKTHYSNASPYVNTRLREIWNEIRGTKTNKRSDLIIVSSVKHSLLGLFIGKNVL